MAPAGLPARRAERPRQRGASTSNAPPAPYDRPNNFAVSGLYQLPFGRGRRLGSGVSGVINQVIGNRAISSGYTFHSRAPIGWGNMIYYGGDLNYDARRVDHTFDTTRFNTVSAQLSQNFRYFPSRFNNFQVDTTNNLNISVTKDFALREKIKLQFRADSFNVMNHALFAAPNVTPTSTAFGVVSSTTNTPRIIQFALRLVY